MCMATPGGGCYAHALLSTTTLDLQHTLLPESLQIKALPGTGW